jgi:phosphotransferase system enzyme I (PtsP)
MTIVARAIGVPVIGRLHDIRHSVEEGEPILVDGDNGSVIIRPTAAAVRLRASHDAQPEAPGRIRGAKNLPGRTIDGVHVSVMVNAGLAEDAAALPMTGADGIGLFRTEFQFLVSATLPGRDRQLGSTPRCSKRRATGRSSSARSTSAATRRCPT